MSNEITPEQIREWANDADEGEDVALDGDTLREIAESLRMPPRKPEDAGEWAAGWNDCLDYIEQMRVFI